MAFFRHWKKLPAGPNELSQLEMYPVYFFWKAPPRLSKRETAISKFNGACVALEPNWNER
jgi:hypothetical protein